MLKSCSFDIQQLLESGQLSIHDNHKWGYEVWCYNGDQCLKIMVVDKPAKSSLMHHPEKVETFVMLQGSLYLWHKESNRLLFPGDVVTIRSGEEHRFAYANERAVFLEVSSHHEDEDVVKLEESEWL